MTYPIEKLFSQPLELATPLNRLGSNAPLEGDVWYRPEQNLVVQVLAPEWDTNELSPEEALEISEKHYEKLQSLGMFVLTHAWESLSKDGFKQPVVFCATPEIPLRDKHVVDTEQPLLRRQIGPKLLSQSIEPLSQYLSWCIASRTPYMLSHPFKASSLNYHFPTQKVFLADPRPSLKIVNDGNRLVAHSDLDELRSYTT